MHINCLDMSISENDLNSIIEKKVPPNDKISNLHAALKPGRIVISGKIRVLLPVKFEADFDMSHTEEQIVAHLADIRPMSAIADQFKNKILEKITESASFLVLDREHESFRISLNDILRTNGLDSHVLVDELRVAAKKLTIKLKGTINL